MEVLMLAGWWEKEKAGVGETCALAIRDLLLHPNISKTKFRPLFWCLISQLAIPLALHLYLTCTFSVLQYPHLGALHSGHSFTMMLILEQPHAHYSGVIRLQRNFMR